MKLSYVSLIAMAVGGPTGYILARCFGTVTAFTIVMATGIIAGLIVFLAPEQKT